MPRKRKIKIEAEDIDYGHSDGENVETDLSKIPETPPIPKKRKRDQTVLWQTPYRPKNAQRTTTAKRTLSNELGPESKKQPKIKVKRKPKEKKNLENSTTGNRATDDYAPVPLPSTVVSLFQGPHRFPSETDQECLFAIGIPPTIFYETEGNKKLLEPVNFLTTNKINKSVRSQKMRKSLVDMTSNLTNNNNSIINNGNDHENLVVPSTSSSSSNEKQLLNNSVYTPGTNDKEPQVKEHLKLKKDGTIYVKLDGRSKPILFPTCRISITRLPDFEN